LASFSSIDRLVKVVAHINQQIDNRNGWSAAAGIGGALMAAAGLTLLLWR